MNFEDRWGDGAHQPNPEPHSSFKNRAFKKLIWLLGLLIAAYIGHRSFVFFQSAMTSTPSTATRFLAADFNPALDLVVAWPSSETERRIATDILTRATKDGNSITVMATRDQLPELQDRLRKTPKTTTIVSTEILPFAVNNIRNIMPFAVQDESGGLRFFLPKTGSNKESETTQQSLVKTLLDRVPTATTQDSDLSKHRFTTNGTGLFLTTYETDTSTMLKQFEQLGSTQTIHLDPLEGEATSSIGLFAQFISTDIVVVGHYTDQQDSTNAVVLGKNVERLEKIETASGPLRVVRIPMPDHTTTMWPSYSEIVFVNRTIFVPLYSSNGGPDAQTALQVFRQAMPGWEVVGIPCDELISTGSSIQKITAKQPRILIAN